MDHLGARCSHLQEWSDGDEGEEEEEEKKRNVPATFVVVLSIKRIKRWTGRAQYYNPCDLEEEEEEEKILFLLKCFKRAKPFFSPLSAGQAATSRRRDKEKGDRPPSCKGMQRLLARAGLLFFCQVRPSPSFSRGGEPWCWWWW